jgi:hypothetical protein
MGIGGALIPGGNDTLLLRLIPALAPNSLYTYLMLILGVASGWLLQRRLQRGRCEVPGCADLPVAPSPADTLDVAPDDRVAQREGSVLRVLRQEDLSGVAPSHD